jgi:tetratricopeptide (TPR) repeat protein
MAEGIAEKAMALDPNLAEPHSVLATFAKTRRDWAQAEEGFLEGIRRNERNATAHLWYSEFLAATGRIEKSYEHLLRANDLDPFYFPVLADVAWAHLHFGNASKSSAIFADLWKQNFRSPEIWVGNLLSQIVLGNAERAREWILLAPNNANVNGFLDTFADIYFDGAKDHGLIHELVWGSGPWPDHRTIAWVGAFLNSDDEILSYLRFRKDRGWPIDTYFMLNPNTNFRLHSEFGALISELGLVDFWDEFGWGDLCRREGSKTVCDGQPDISILQPLTNRLISDTEIDR